MSNEKMREEFEEWIMARSQGLPDWVFPNLLRRDNGYAVGWVDTAFEAWQASRADLCVELPKIVNSEWACTSDECAAMRDAIRFCKRAIESTGVKTK